MKRMKQITISLENAGMMPLSNADLVEVYRKAKHLKLPEDFIRLVERALQLRNITPIPAIDKED